jgi:cytochrome oxidase assembly protein ShyY1
VYRFALRPKWILSHLFVIALVVTMVNLGLWQHRKLDHRKASNRVVEQNLAAPGVPIDRLVTTTSSDDAVARVANRHVTVSGTYEPDAQVIVRSRSLDGDPGSWVLTPLRRSDGSLVVVNRGWIPNDGSFLAVPRQYVLPTGVVHVEGLLQPPQTRGAFGPRDPPTGTLTNLARADIARYAKQLDGPVVPAWVQLQKETPAPAAGTDAPRILAPPELDEGPYFSYFVQWFIFSTIAVVGYPLILRRNARERLERVNDGDDADSEDEGDLPEVDPAHEAGVSADGRA